MAASSMLAEQRPLHAAHASLVAPCASPPPPCLQTNQYPVNNTIFTGGNKCTPLFCPANTVAVPAVRARAASSAAAQAPSPCSHLLLVSRPHSSVPLC